MAVRYIISDDNDSVASLSDVTSPVTITAATQADPCVVTAPGHKFVANDMIAIRSVTGMTELNDNVYFVTAPSGDDFSLLGIDSTLFSAYSAGGNATRIFSTLPTGKSVAVTFNDAISKIKIIDTVQRLKEKLIQLL